MFMNFYNIQIGLNALPVGYNTYIKPTTACDLDNAISKKARESTLGSLIISNAYACKK